MRSLNIDSDLMPSIISRPFRGVILLVVITACATVWPKQSVTTTSAPLDALTCAASAGKQMGYKLNYLDSTRLQLTLRKEDKAPLSAEADARRNVDQIELSINGASSGGAASGSAGVHVTIRAETIFQEETKRGLTDDDVAASPTVKADADTLIARCAPASSV